jgi:hypothetical protein
MSVSWQSGWVFILSIAGFTASPSKSHSEMFRRGVQSDESNGAALTTNFLRAQWAHPGDVTSILLLIGGNVIQVCNRLDFFVKRIVEKRLLNFCLL